MNKVIDSMLAHRSIRSYTDRTVSDEDLNSIIRAVQAAPNWVNLQLVSIIAVKNTDHRRRLAELCGNQVHIAEAPVFLVFCTDYHRVALACHKKEQTLDEVMQDIDTLLVGAHEVGIALEAAGVAAESLGLSLKGLRGMHLSLSMLGISETAAETCTRSACGKIPLWSPVTTSCMPLMFLRSPLQFQKPWTPSVRQPAYKRPVRKALS